MAAQKQQEVERLKKEYEKEIDVLKKESDLLSSESLLTSTRMAADITGIADPTPTSDIISGAIAWAQGDYLDALLSGISAIPYVGDACAKPVKFYRGNKKIARLLMQLDDINKKVALFEEKIRNVSIEASKKIAKQFWESSACPLSQRMPSLTRGTWRGARGNSVWEYEGIAVPYENGFPQFEKAYRKGPDAAYLPPPIYPRKGGFVEIPHMTGNNKLDFDAADVAMRKKLGDPNWTKPADYTWHHKEDGTTMILVHRDFHAPGTHAGGASLSRNPSY